MQQVGAGGKGICFACAEDAKPKTGTTVVVTEASPDAKGKVTIRNVNTNETLEGTPALIEHPNEGEIVIRLTIDQLGQDGIINTLLQSAYDAIDNMPPFKTLKETKQAIWIQENIQTLMTPNREKRKYTKRDNPPQEGTPDKSGAQATNTR